MTRSICLAAALCLAAGTAAAQHAHRHAPSHEHGSARVGIALQGGSVSIELTAPLDGLLGFEHRPRTAAQRQAAQALRETLGTPQRLFVLPEAARCRSVETELHADTLEPAPAATGVSAGAEHADVEALYRFDCENPAALRELHVALFETFARLRRVDVEVAGPGGQSKRRLVRGQRTVPLGR